MSNNSNDEFENGYKIIRPKKIFWPEPYPKDNPLEKGIKCGLCGMTFDYNKAYGYVCTTTGCPIYPQITC